MWAVAVHTTPLPMSGMWPAAMYKSASCNHESNCTATMNEWQRRACMANTKINVLLWVLSWNSVVDLGFWKEGGSQLTAHKAWHCEKIFQPCTTFVYHTHHFPQRPYSVSEWKSTWLASQLMIIDVLIDHRLFLLEFVLWCSCNWIINLEQLTLSLANNPWSSGTSGIVKY